MTEITPEALVRLAGWDTPTICNGLEMLDPAWRLSGYTTRPFVALDASLPPIVGYARTATVRASAPPSGSADQVAETRKSYYAHVASGPAPSITVIQDLDPQPGVGAFWGEVNTTVHKGLGALGFVTNGSMRDLAESAKGFQGLAGLVGPSHAWVHVVDFGGQVNVHGMNVANGDIIHADIHGAVIIPPEAVAALPDAIDLISRREAEILAAARKADFSIDTLLQAMSDAADIH